MSATSVAREGARAFVHARIKGGCTGSLGGQNWEHREECNTRTADVEARDASAVEVERTMREALEACGGLQFGECPVCRHRISKCDKNPIWGSETCGGHLARAALARVASLRGGTR